MGGAEKETARARSCRQWEERRLLRRAVRKYTFPAKIQKTVDPASHLEYSLPRNKRICARARPAAGQERRGHEVWQDPELLRGCTRPSPPRPVCAWLRPNPAKPSQERLGAPDGACCVVCSECVHVCDEVHKCPRGVQDAVTRLHRSWGPGHPSGRVPSLVLLPLCL